MFPVSKFLSLVRTNAEPRPGCTCMNSIGRSKKQSRARLRSVSRTFVPRFPLAGESRPETLDKKARCGVLRARPVVVVVVSRAPVIFQGAESISRERPTLKSAVEHVSARTYRANLVSHHRACTPASHPSRRPSSRPRRDAPSRLLARASTRRRTLTGPRAVRFARAAPARTRERWRWNATRRTWRGGVTSPRGGATGRRGGGRYKSDYCCGCGRMNTAGFTVGDSGCD